MLVEPVPELVHRREQAVEVVIEVAGSDSDVLRPPVARERVDSRVEAPGLVVEPEALCHFELEALLQIQRERPRSRSRDGIRACDLAHEWRLVLLEVVEGLADERGLHSGLVVVEQHVVGLVVVVEAFDVASRELEVLAQDGQEGSRSRCAPARRPRPGSRAWTHATSQRAALTEPCAPSPSRGASPGSGSPRTSRSRAVLRTPRVARGAGRSRGR